MIGEPLARYRELVVAIEEYAGAALPDEHPVEACKRLMDAREARLLQHF